MMRLRRFELVFVGITLAFLFFMGGFFTGRNFNQVTVDSFDSFRVETAVGSESLEISARFQSSDTAPTAPVDDSDSSDSNVSTDGLGNNVANNASSSDDFSSQGSEAQSGESPGMPRGGDGRININTASKNELMDLSGIGPSLADRIIEYRNNNGAFSTIEEIMNVPGIAEGRFARIKDRITVG